MTVIYHEDQRSVLRGAGAAALVFVLAWLMTACSVPITPKPPTPPPGVRPIAVNFTQPITSVRVWFDGGGIPTPQDFSAVGQRVGFPAFPAAGADPSNVHIRADGYQPYDCVTHVPDGSYDFFVGTMPGATANGYGQGWFVGTDGSSCPAALTPLVPPLPQPVARSPLMLEPNDPTGLVCPHQELVTVPSGPDRRFWRGDAWGVTVPGLPFVAGGSSRHPERALSWFLDRWELDAQQDILNANRARGYTHFTLSWPDSRDGAGQSAEDFAQTAVRVNAAIPFVHVMLTSKDFDPANADAPTRMAAVSPVIDALIAHGFTGDNLILGVGWELDLFNEGQLLEDFIHALHAKYPQFDLYVHFTTYKTSWQPDGKPRAQFWQATAGELTGLLYQGNPSDACGLMAAHFNDAQVPASGLAAVGAVLVPWELVAAEEFDNDHPDEDDANARAWSVMQTPGPILAAGAGNGWRFPDGSPALAAYPVKP